MLSGSTFIYFDKLNKASHNKRMLKHFVLLIILSSFFSSCSTIRFRSRGSIPLSFNSETGNSKEVEIKGSKEFYLGGFIPYHHDVFLDEEISKAGYTTLSKISLDDTNTLKNMLISVGTLGFYCPRQYIIKGLTK